MELIEVIAVSSVVKELDNTLEKAFGEKVFLISNKIKTGLNILYTSKESLGADRITTAIAASRIFLAQNVIIIDCGTATTLCVLTKKKEYLGGAIFPGINMSVKSLHEKTSKLPTVEIKKPKSIIGRSTSECIQLGVYLNQLSTLKDLSSRIKKEYFQAEEVLVIGTGGDASLYEEEGLFDKIIPELAFYGMYEALSLNSLIKESPYATR